MPWTAEAKKDAILLLGIVVPLLIFGLGVLGYFIAKAVGLGDGSIWVALGMSAIGLVLSIAVTFKIGEKYEKPRPFIQ